MQSELYKVNYVISGFQYVMNCYNHYIKKDGSIIPSVDSKSLCREEMEETPVYSNQESYVYVRSEDCINDIIEGITKHYSSSYILDCKVRFISVSRMFPVNFTIIDKEVVPQYS